MQNYIHFLLTKESTDIKSLISGCKVLKLEFNKKYYDLLHKFNETYDIQDILDSFRFIYFNECDDVELNKLNTKQLIDICKMLNLNSKGNIQQMIDRIINIKNKIFNNNKTIDIDEYTFDELKNKCKKLNINSVGTKSVLCNKLNEFFSGKLIVENLPENELGDINEYKKIELEKICETLKINKDGTKLDIYNRIVKYYYIKNNKEIIENNIKNFKTKLNKHTTKELIEYCNIINISKTKTKEKIIDKFIEYYQYNNYDFNLLPNELEIKNVKTCSNCKKEYDNSQFINVLTKKTTKNCANCRIPKIKINEEDEYSLKKYILSLKINKKCNNCEDNNIEHLEFDHFDSEGKIDENNKKLKCVGQLDTKELIDIEVKKCVLLCAKCHCKKTTQELIKKYENYEYSENKNTRKAMKLRKQNLQKVNEIKVKIGGCQNIECKDIFDNTNFSFYEFNHINPDNKYMGVCEMVNKGASWKDIEIEINKCELLCRYCHKQKSKENHIENKQEAEHSKHEIKTKSTKKLNIELATEIRKIWNTDFSIQLKDLCEKYSLSQSSLRDVLYNRSYKDENYVRVENRPIFNESKRKLTDAQVLEIKELFKTQKYTQQQLADKFNVSRANIGSILNNKSRVIPQNII